MAATVLTYKRSKRYVTNPPDSKTKAHGLVGELWVHGLMFETIERMDGYVHLPGNRSYPLSSMYWHTRLGYVVNPWHPVKNRWGKRAGILIHRGAIPSNFQGCIGVGFFEGKKLRRSDNSMHAIYEQCGGKIGEKKRVVVTLRVEGHMPRLKDCKPFVATR